VIDRWGRILVRRAGLVVAVGLLFLLAAGVYGAGVFSSLSQGGFEDPGSESKLELAAEREEFGNRNIDIVAIYSDRDLVATDAEFRSAVEKTLADIPKGVVSSAVTYYDTQQQDLLSKNEHATQVLISLVGTNQDELLTSWEKLEPALDAEGLRTDVAGNFAVYADVNEISESDLRQAELFSLPVLLILSLLIFGSVVAAMMPVLVGVFTVVGAIAVVRLLTLVTDVSVFSVNVITLIGLGLAVDYALFIISRFREELTRLPDGVPTAVPTAIRSTMATAGRTVLFSGLTVAASLSALLVFPQPFFKSMAYGGVAAVLVAMLCALTVLPAALRLLGRRIDSGRLPLIHRQHQPAHKAGPDEHPEKGGWARLAYWVMRRPLVVAAVVAGALLLVASPFLGAKWGSVDHRVLPEDAPSRVAAEMLASEFGAEQTTAQVFLRGAGPEAVRAFTEKVEELPRIESVAPVDDNADATLLRATWNGSSQSQLSQAIVERLRALEPAEGEVLVGGLTAETVDLVDSVAEKLPWMGLIVVSVMLVLLFVAFGSLVLPIKAVFMNIVSITASFGVVTWIFADGHLEGLLGFESQGFLDATQPILMLAILFGLSMDYEVFLLSRVREEWDASGDNTRAVAVGLQRTGRIITSAALLLAVVIGAFSTSGIVLMKVLGIGMLVALIVDATVVRALLVPATMKLLGSANWWAPGPMRRWWERHGFRETDESAPPRLAERPV
jgi:uncharacterized membrane protein YdfJ with MMPL/SSD domain